jgi:hypothetical protein
VKVAVAVLAVDDPLTTTRALKKSNVSGLGGNGSSNALPVAASGLADSESKFSRPCSESPSVWL